MTNSNEADLRELARVIRKLEPKTSDASITILAHENREQIIAALKAGLDHDVPVQASSGEYANHLATIRVGSNKYTIALDWRDVYISEINYCPCRIPPRSHGVLVYHIDYPGVIYDVSRILADNEINISKLNVSREQKGKNALLVSLTDEAITAEVAAVMETLPQITKVISLQ
ncbi:ACT domain-containing protein [Brevibacillus ruminantium]|uniref:ACT domain-containing protein n=1 Tax=Brevibacillus ruminantium TaxID=2950604 RepID=A0ABY4WN57_9BACL|nr:ACT domain-containing protein [Brevibacillus ruminantium]USG68191.1 ACT domain-containing protein [Brevibacillus ruminantium]